MRRTNEGVAVLFVVWAAREVVRITLEAARHRLQQWHESRTTS
ncbi:hypothetical protein [Nannocystis radixulma]|uniref:Uncharacterized protein n=1 Tax=Nannocystis radixulma TaxID=2995305 RepID=A0ABT5BG31_9BACT|nr:hypothetical protein [Nannocystis radixulma]MDC0671931.1 hypothetical protein [Nannocystis radixulma]